MTFENYMKKGIRFREVISKASNVGAFQCKIASGKKGILRHFEIMVT